MIPAQYPSGKSNLPILSVSAASFYRRDAEAQRESREGIEGGARSSPHSRHCRPLLFNLCFICD